MRLDGYSAERARQERGLVERCEAALTQLNARAGAAQRRAQIPQRSGRWPAHVAAHSRITVTAAEAGCQAIAVTWTRRTVRWPRIPAFIACAAVRPTGTRTPWAHLRHAHRWRGRLPLAPGRARPAAISYHKPQRADGHLFLTVLAYQLVQVLRTRLRAHGEHARWAPPGHPGGPQRAPATYPRPARRTLPVRTVTQAEPAQRALSAALGGAPQPGRVRQTIN